MRPPPRPRPDLDDLRVYSTSSVAGGSIFLHANENPYPLPERVTEAIVERLRAAELNRYPAPTGALVTEVRDAIASYAGVDPSWVWLGSGSNEVLLQAFLAYGGPGRQAMLFEPTYRMHHRQARIAGTSVVEVRRRADFSIDVDPAVAQIRRVRPDVVVVCTPNNPTGTLTAPDDVWTIAGAAEGLVVVDEAYHEFCGVSVVDRLGTARNVVVSRTFSKAFRLAGARLGYLIGPPELLEPLDRVRMPYSVGIPSLVVAAAVLAHHDDVLSVVPEIVAERERLERELAGLRGVEVFPSAANSVLFRHPEAQRLLAGLAADGIVVRDFSSLPGCEDCLRVTAGRPDENDALLRSLRALLG